MTTSDTQPELLTGAALLAALDDGLDTIWQLAGWHSDDEADANNTHPADNVAHINGLVRRETSRLRTLIAANGDLATDRLGTP